MKLLKIENRKGFYTSDGKTYNEISDISKEDILKILYLIYENSICSLDKIENQEDIVNDVERLIYSNLYSKLEAFMKNRLSIKTKLDDDVKEIKEKYILTDH